MKIKLVESAQPINKLDYNIQNIVLPTLAKYGFDLNTTPSKLNPYEYVFTGYSKKYDTYTKADMVTSNKELDVWNQMDEDFTADLYIKLYLGMDEVMRGPISSREPKTIIDELEYNPEVGEEIDKAKPANKEQLQNSKLYPPASETSKYKAMTADEWRAELKKQEELVHRAADALYTTYTQDEIYKMYQDYNDNGTPYPQVLLDYRKAHDDYNYFLKSIYPLF